MFYVMRLPCLMEDEGRSHMCGHYPSKVEAEKAIDRLSENDTGYFRKSDFKILEG